MHNNSNNWEKAALSDIADSVPHSIVDGPFGSNLTADEYSTTGIRLIQLQNIGDGFWVDDNKKFIPPLKFKELIRHAAHPGDIAIAKMAEPVARACLIPPVSNLFLVVADCIKLTINPLKYDSKFIVYMINHRNFRKQAEYKSSGTTRQRINLSILKTIELLIPPFKEQQRIAQILDTLDTQIQETGRLITKLKQVKAGLLHDLLTRGIDEHGEMRDSVAHPEQFKESPFGLVPREWETSELSYVCTKITDGCHQSVKTSAGNIPFLYVSCIRNGQILWDQGAKISEEIYKVISKGREPKQGLILYTVVGSYGNAAMVENDLPFSFQRHIAYILPDSTKVKPAFLVNWLNSSWCHSYADKVALGNAQKTITLSHLKHLPIPLAGCEEQWRIAQVLKIHDTRISAEESHLNKLKQIKKGLMHDLLTGNVRVTQLVGSDGQ